MTPKEHDRVRLKNGTTGVVLVDYDGMNFCVEMDMSAVDKWNATLDELLPTIHITDIIEIIE